MRSAWTGIPAVFLLLGVASAQEVRVGSDAQREAGKRIYDAKCVQCHGTAGDGDGVAGPYFNPSPRDFTLGLFKIRTTPSGELPTHEDLVRVIREGMPYTGMPPWPGLSKEELDNVTFHVKTFSDLFSDPDFVPTPIEIPKAPKFTEESAALGRGIYEENKCADCHGDLGRSDGKSALTLTNERGEPIRPADLTKRWTFRGGSTREDIYRTFTTGLNGTPMPSYADLISEEDRWHLVDYVYSLSPRGEADYSDLVVAAATEEELDLARGPALFEEASPAYFPVFGQIIEPGRNFSPTVTGIEVKAVYNREEVAFLLTWNDMSADTSGLNGPELEVPELRPGAPEEEEGDETAYSDAVAVQIPSRSTAGSAKPYFLFGDPRNSVNVWFADLAADRGQVFIGRGSRSLEPGGGIASRSSFENGQWNVVFKRKRLVEDGLPFEEGRFVPVAFSVWDGANRERGNRRGVTSWYHAYLSPMHEQSKAMPIAGYVLLTLMLEVATIQMVRIKGGRPGFSFLSWSRALERSQQSGIDLGFSLLGGLVATIAMTLFLYLAMPIILGSKFDIGSIISETLNVGWTLGVAVHLLLGALVFPLFFVGYFYPRFPGPAWAKGLVWGALLWLVAEVVAIPIAMGGVFHANTGGAGAAGGFLIGHLIYGSLLGAIAGSSRPD